MTSLAVLGVADPALGGAARGIPLRDRKGCIKAFAVVDAEDYEGVAQHRWYLNSQGYAVRQVTVAVKKQRTLPMHRYLIGLGFGDARTVDHVNHDTLDNRRENLVVMGRLRAPAVVHLESTESLYAD